MEYQRHQSNENEDLDPVAEEMEEAHKAGELTDEKVEEILQECGVLPRSSRFGPLNPKSCNVCGHSDKPLRTWKAGTLNPNAYICHECYRRYVQWKGLMGLPQEFDRQLTLDPVRRARCGCGREMTATGDQGHPPAWCGECEKERKRYEANSKGPSLLILPGKG